MQPSPPLDDTDRKLLALLQQNAQLTIKEMAGQIGLSPTAVHDRVKKLEEAGVIERYVALLDKKKIGPALVVYCNVTLSKQSQATFLAFNQAIAAMPEVLEANVVSGNSDYLLKIIVRDMDAYQDFYLARLAALDGVDKISSFFVMSEVKNTTQLPL
jgi:Lrp/AsnC family transcriptional regulator, leucine-responsive regulatory protein